MNMLQTNSSVLSNHQIFNPASTGSPRFDLYNHLSKLPQTARIDFEEHSVIGGHIYRVEPDLCSEDKSEAESRIVSVPYAMRVLGNLEDAIEFIRCVKLIAGDDARPFNLQIIASHYYKEVRIGRPVNEVLKEMGMLAIQLNAVTATIEERQFDEPVEIEVKTDDNKQLSPGERRAMFDARAAEVLGEKETKTSIFDLELRAITRFRSNVSGFAYDVFAAYLSEQESTIENVEELDALYESYEATYEQYDEDNVVSLHMSDGEKVVVVGNLDDDIDEESLPEESRHLAKELYELFVSGFPLIDCGEDNSKVEGVTLKSFMRDSRTGERFSVPFTVYGIDSWLDYAIEEVFCERVIRTARKLIVVPVIRQTDGRITKVKLHEQTSTSEVCPSSSERELTRAVLETLLERWKADFHLRSLNANEIYREFISRIERADDTCEIAQIKKEAWNYKEQNQLSIKLFTALMTKASVRASLLESMPLKKERATQNGIRKFVIIQPLLELIPKLKGKTVSDFALKLHELPRQENERVRAHFQSLNPYLYSRVLDGLLTELEKASPKRLGYFRWAFYPGNKPEHPFHVLTREDQCAAWELLKELSCPKEKESRILPLLDIAESEEQRHAAAAVAV